MADGGPALAAGQRPLCHRRPAVRTHLHQLHPQRGRSLPAIEELAESTGALYAGKDGKTGETLMKTVLAPMFAIANLKVMSWVGHNIFGNRDGLVLDDPANKSSKVDTKDRVVTQILGYKPSTLVTIEYLPDMGDWKTAWDHIHFQGFLGTKMALQFTWQGCDSLLAAPLAIDLARLADLEKRRGGRGLMRHLASFFKSPEGVEENDFFRQFELLARYVAGSSHRADGVEAPRAPSAALNGLPGSSVDERASVSIIESHGNDRPCDSPSAPTRTCGIRSTKRPSGSRPSATRAWSCWPTCPTPGRPGCSTSRSGRSSRPWSGPGCRSRTSTRS